VLGEILHQALRLIDGKREERGGGSVEKNVTAGSDSSVSEQGQSQGQTFPANSRTSVPNHVTIPTGVVVKVPRSAACNDSNTTPSPYQQTQSQTQLDEEGEGQEEGDFYWIENGMRRIIPDRETALLYTNKSSPSGHLRLIDLSHTNTSSSTTTTTNTTTSSRSARDVVCGMPLLLEPSLTWKDKSLYRIPTSKEIFVVSDSSEGGQRLKQRHSLNSIQVVFNHGLDLDLVQVILANDMNTFPLGEPWYA
jgi:hypothetical protein